MSSLAAMRASIKQIYLTEAWSKRVDKMHRNQVVAIYIRYKACHFEPDLFKGKKKTHVQIKHVKYTCSACGAQYVRDNPELAECELCGSENILKEIES